jgi:hypothetical protein
MGQEGDGLREIAFVTCEKFPEVWKDDALALGPLGDLGIRVRPAVWSDPAVDWARFEAVVLRGSWDYHERLPEFEAWLERLEDLGARVWNPLPVIRWNLRKTYLEDLAAAGVPVVPTRFVGPGSLDALLGSIAAAPWPEVVVKPAVSAGAFRTFRLERESAAARAGELAPLAASGEATLLQPFLSEVLEEGEWSLIFLGGAFSHAVRKVPARGDFRVQEMWGGRTLSEPPPADAREAARAVLAAVREPLLHARVDLVRHEGAPCLVELELIEPILFLANDPGAPRRFAEAIAGRLLA